MNSRKFKSALIGALLVGLAQFIGALLAGLGMEQEAASNLANTISIAVGTLFGAHILGTAHEDAAKKRNAPPEVVEQQIQAAAEKVGAKVAGQVQVVKEEATRNIKVTLEQLDDTIKSRLEKLAEELKARFGK